MFSLILLLFFCTGDADELGQVLNQISPDHTKAERLAALDKLKEIGKRDTQRSEEVLTLACRDDDAEIRAKAVVALGLTMIGQECPLAIVEALRDKHARVRSQASDVLGLFERFPPDAKSILFVAAKSDDRYVRQSIPHALAAQGKTGDVVVALEALFADADPFVANNAHASHYQVTNDLQVYVGHLLRKLVDLTPEARAKESPKETDQRELLRLSGAMVLHDLTRERPVDLATALVAHLSHKQPAIRQCALRQLRALCIVSKRSHVAVKQINPRKQLQTIAERDPDERVRDWAGIVLNVLESGPPDDAPEKLESLKSLDQ